MTTTATMFQVGTCFIGWSKEMYDAGMVILETLNKTVLESKNVDNTNVTLKRDSGKRPNIQNFLCNGLEAMWKKSTDWKCKEGFR